RARGDAGAQCVAVPAQAEEMIPLRRGDPVERGVLDAVAVDDLRAGLELLAAGAVQALVFRLEQVVGVAGTDAPEQRGDGPGVPRLSSADPVVVAAFQAAPVVREA